MQNDALFEAPLPHMAFQNSTAYAEPEFEFEDEWETSVDSDYSRQPEFENEWEMEDISAYTEPEFEDEWETDGISAYAESEFEDEWEMEDEDGYNSLEYENEGDYFFKKLRARLARGWKKFKKGAGRVLKRVAPKLATVFGGMIPGVGGITGPLAGKLTKALVKEAEMEAAQMEAEFFGMNEADAEVAPTEMAKEAALAEFLAAQAADATTEAEAEAFVSAALPATIASMNATQLLRHVIPIMVQANALLAQVLMKEGWEGKQLARAIPAIQRRTVATLKAEARAGKPINRQKAVRATAAATRQVLKPGKVEKAVKRNMVLQSRTARPPRKQRVGHRESESYCPTCGSR
ncbi:MAG: hypothetical protein SAK29_04790 [Scytonema sp. PMC 1069.18]|nr:hypothetical protein [Scytonema sp. PMC 1069.18]MEC4881089.1 hypothetical protein [Scytonema sp. PMC 1070.18]